MVEKVYNHILVTIDVTKDDNDRLLEKIQSLRGVLLGDFTILHVVAPFPAYSGAGLAMMADFNEGQRQEADKVLAEFSEKLAAYGSVKTLNEVGHPAGMIIEVADKIKADLIIIGSHGRHGFGALIGNTANRVLNHAHCDVLVVRLEDQ